MLLMTATTDTIKITTSAAVTVDVHASYVDASNANPPVVQGDTMGRQNTAISTATTTTVVSAPGSNDVRNVKTLHARNKHASSSVDVTVLFDQNGTQYELFKATLKTGEHLEYVEGIGFFVVANTAKLDVKVRVSGSDVANSTTSFADITGLTYAVESGKFYGFEAHIFALSAATTTGIQFGVNGPSMTALRVSALSTVTGSATAAAMSAPVADITALDTNIVTQTTGPANVTPHILMGYFNPSASGTFALRVRSEVAASAVTVKVGSWLHLFELDN